MKDFVDPFSLPGNVDRIDVGEGLDQLVLDSIKAHGLAGYRKCTVEKITEHINGIHLTEPFPLDKSEIKQIVTNLMRQGKIYGFDTEVGKCLALTPNPSQVLVLD